MQPSKREAEVLAALNHPNITAIYGFEKTPDVTALVMELVEGEDLPRDRARADASPTRCLSRADRRGPRGGARQGIIHRDLKPANIKVGPTGR